MTAPTVGPAVVPTEWVARLASLVATIRHDWDEAGIRTALHKVADRPLGVVAAAAVTAALTRTDQRTPAVIAMTGTHWPDGTAFQATEPGVVTYCEHGDPGSRCAVCHPRAEHRGVGPTPEQRQAMRQAIADARDAINRLERTNP